MSNWNWIFFRVTGKKLAQFFDEWHEKNDAAHDAMLAFSASVGGDTEQYGSYETVMGRTIPAIHFSEAPDSTIWKRLDRKDDRFWVPRATKAAKEVRDEFERLCGLYPSKQDVAEQIGFEMLQAGFVCKPLFAKTDGKYWYVSTPEYFTPQKGKGLTRISDLAYDKVAATVAS